MVHGIAPLGEVAHGSLVVAAAVPRARTVGDRNENSLPVLLLLDENQEVLRNIQDGSLHDLDRGEATHASEDDHDHCSRGEVHCDLAVGIHVAEMLHFPPVGALRMDEVAKNRHREVEEDHSRDVHVHHCYHHIVDL